MSSREGADRTDPPVPGEPVHDLAWLGTLLLLLGSSFTLRHVSSAWAGTLVGLVGLVGVGSWLVLLARTRRHGSGSRSLPFVVSAAAVVVLVALGARATGH